MNRNRRIRAHRKLWRWVSAHPEFPAEMAKIHWPGWKRNGGRYEGMLNDCFLCSYSSGCCLLKWPELTTCSPFNPESLYHRWSYASTLEEQSKFAKQIAELPIDRNVK